MNDTDMVKLVRPYEESILIIAEVLKMEREADKFMTAKEMMNHIMMRGGGSLDASMVQAMVLNIMKQRY